MSSLEETHNGLSAELISLKTQWIATRQAWRDPVGDRFEKDFWKPLEEESLRYLDALKVLADILQQADIHAR